MKILYLSHYSINIQKIGNIGFCPYVDAIMYALKLSGHSVYVVGETDDFIEILNKLNDYDVLCMYPTYFHMSMIDRIRDINNDIIIIAIEDVTQPAHRGIDIELFNKFDYHMNWLDIESDVPKLNLPPVIDCQALIQEYPYDLPDILTATTLHMWRTDKFSPLPSIELACELGLDIIIPAGFDASELDKYSNVTVIEYCNHLKLMHRIHTVIQVSSGSLAPGSTAIKAAIAGIPVISGRNYWQKCLYPELIANDYNEARDRVLPLLDDYNCYEWICDKAFDRLVSYDLYSNYNKLNNIFIERIT